MEESRNTRAITAQVCIKVHFNLGKFSEGILGKNFEVENFQLLTMIFSEDFLSVEIFLEWKQAFLQLNYALPGGVARNFK
jgi:hypothetical protein